MNGFLLYKALLHTAGFFVNSPTAILSNFKTMAVRVHNVASIPGDGIGVEIIENTVQMLIGIEKRVGTFELKFTSFDWGSERYKELRAYMPKDGLDIIKNLMLSCSVRSGHQVSYKSLETYVKGA